VQNYLMHMGFVPDAQIKALRRAPAGDPTVYGIDGMEIALRRETAEAIHVRAVDASDLSEIDDRPDDLTAFAKRDVPTEINEFAGAAR
jgi:Fe2+ transport system protein FeoA